MVTTILWILAIVAIIACILIFLIFNWYKGFISEAATARPWTTFKTLDEESNIHQILQTAQVTPLDDVFQLLEKPAPIYFFYVSGKDAIGTWQKLRAIVDETGYWPLLLGSGQHIEEITENWEPLSEEDRADLLKEISEEELKDEQSVEGILQKAQQLDPNHLLKKWAQDLTSDEVSSTMGEWPDGKVSPNDQYTLPTNILTGEFLKEIPIGLIPTKISWEVPAYLKFGGWNANPYPAEHVAMMKYWHERYGAELVGMGNDLIEMHIPSPPMNKEQAVALAKEQYYYCDDIVLQGTQTIHNLGATVINAPTWYFWWD